MVFTSCASKYKSINPNKTIFTNELESDGIFFSYKYNILRENGNKKYANKELKKGIHVAALRIINRSSKAIQFGRSVNLYINNTKIGSLDPLLVKKALKQPIAIYGFYLFLIPVPISSVKSSNVTDVSYSGYIIGPGLALSNMLFASKANKQFLEELNQFNLSDKVIYPGDEVYGLIGLVYTGYDPLTIKTD